MTNFLHWRKMTWVLLLWSASMATWLVAGDPGPVPAGFLWLLGLTILGTGWFMTQPLIRQGRGLREGFFVLPRPGNWRFLNFHRSF
jgi:hypothetical protein